MDDYEADTPLVTLSIVFRSASAP